MPQGFQTFRADGSVQIDVTTRLVRHLRSVVIAPPTVGTISVPDMATGTPFWTLVPTQVGTVQTSRAPAIKVEGTNITWTWPSGQAQVPYELTVMVW